MRLLTITLRFLYLHTWVMRDSAVWLGCNTIIDKWRNLDTLLLLLVEVVVVVVVVVLLLLLLLLSLFFNGIDII